MLQPLEQIDNHRVEFMIVDKNIRLILDLKKLSCKLLDEEKIWSSFEELEKELVGWILRLLYECPTCYGSGID